MTTEGESRPPNIDEVRTRRLAVVDDAGNERVVIELVQDHIEFRLIAEDQVNRCEVLVFGGQQTSDLVAGIELWCNGNSVGGCSVVASDEHVEFNSVP